MITYLRQACRRLSGCFGRGGKSSPGQALVLQAIFLTGLLGVGAAAVDVGYLYTGRGSLQAAIDAAARAGAAGLEISILNAQLQAQEIAEANTVYGQTVSLELTDIEYGTYDFSSKTFTPSLIDINAVRITKQMSFPLFFAQVLGIETAGITAQAVGVMTKNPPFCGVIFSNLNLSIDDNKFTDSYDSGQGAYDPATAQSNGSLCSNGDISLSKIGVNGDATPGPGMSVSLSSGASVSGSTAAASEPFQPPVIDPDALADAAINNDNDTIGLTALGNNPVGTSLLGPTFSISGTGESITLNSGTYYFYSFNKGDNAQIFIDASGGPVVVYITGSLDVSGPGGVNKDGEPGGLIFLVSEGTVDLTNRGRLSAVVIAPASAVTLGDVGHYFGAVSASQVTVSGGKPLHYDEDLPNQQIPGVGGTTKVALGG